MNRLALLGLLVLLVAAAAGLFVVFGADAAPPPGPAPDATVPASVPAAGELAEAPRTDAPAEAAGERQSVAVPLGDPMLDPEIRAALTGFEGRVVDHAGKPVPDCGVRIYRGAMDTILQPNVDLFADLPTLEPQYVAGETQTGSDGRFRIDGVWPRAFYVLFAGIGTDAPMHQLLTKTPSPGETVDLGDVVLPDAAVLTGIVVDEEGEPLPGVLVRGADLPGTLTAMFPVERFDPQGALLIREAQAKVKVVEMPAWVKSAFDRLPIPTTQTDGEGRFRLVGLVPGSNMFAATKRGYLSEVKPGIPLKAGQTKDLGKIRLRRGEELLGKVVDAAGKPVAGAEVFAGSTINIAPVDLAQSLGQTDEEGRFRGYGFAPGKVTVAARRAKGHAWVLAEPQPVIGEVTVTLPGTFKLTAAITTPDGAAAKTPRLKLLQGEAGDGAAEATVMGFLPPIDLKDRVTRTEDGRHEIENLLAGDYTLIADAEGFAMGHFEVKVVDADVEAAIALQPREEYRVRVVGPEGQPIRNAAIVAEARGGKKVFDMPLHCGRTDREGRLTITQLRGETLRVSADHPRWGIVHGEGKRDAEILLRMQHPGAIRGVLTVNGEQPLPGKYTVAIMVRGDTRGPLEATPTLLTPALDGAFGMKAVQPGKARVHVIPSLDVLRSPGAIFTFAQEMMLGGDDKEESVDVRSGETAEIRIDAGEKVIDGPTGHVFGSVTVDGRVGAGYSVMIWSQNGGNRRGVKVDERGMFDLGQLPVGRVSVNLHGGTDSVFDMGRNLWSSSFELKLGEEREVRIEVHTTAISGHCYWRDGSPAAGVWVQGHGKPKGTDGQGELWLGESTDANGRFHFDKATAGTWRFEARAHGDTRPGRGRIENVVVEAGVAVDGLRIEITPSLLVKGRVEMAAFGAERPQWVWVSFHRRPDPAKGAVPTGDSVGEYVDSSGVNMEDGTFTADGLEPGTYQVRIGGSFPERKHKDFRADDVEVPPGGAENLLLRPVAIQPRTGNG